MANLGDCAICLEARANPVLTPCLHVFCRRCIQNWIENHSNSCPICRHPISRGRDALQSIRSNVTPRRANYWPAPASHAQPEAPAAQGTVAVFAAIANHPTDSSAVTNAATNAATNAVTRATSNLITATTNNFPRPIARSTYTRCTYTCPYSERQANRRTGGKLVQNFQ